MSTDSKSSSGIGFTGLLTVLFIGLKLTHVINWSWWWVISPLWIGFAVSVVVLIVTRIIPRKSPLERAVQGWKRNRP